MINRVAEALCEQMPSLGSPSAPMVMSLARAAIAAMREPTYGMIGMGEIEIERPGNDETNSTYELHHEEVKKIWHIMIDEALR